MPNPMNNSSLATSTTTSTNTNHTTNNTNTPTPPPLPSSSSQVPLQPPRFPGTISNRRVSYILSPATTHPPPPILQIPLPGQARHPNRRFDPRPLIIHALQPPRASPSPIHQPTHPRHSLGVNALAIDLSTHIHNHQGPQGILYTGAKDGLIAAWELAIPTKPRARAPYDSSYHPFEDSDHSAPSDSHSYTVPPPCRSSPSSSSHDEIDYEDRFEIDQQVLAQAAPPPSTLRQCVQTHTDWCNDLILCNHNQTLISASSDRTLKAWSPHSPDLALSPITIGSHSDYVKALAHPRHAGWVASGGLDRKIKLWDVHETRLHPVVNFPDDAIQSSIYSLATTPTGSILAAGSPSRVIRLHDPRSSVQLAKLVGHTDNVRALLLSDDGSHLLSASSDATVKLWDVGMQRCLHTFSHHSSSVWALASRHPRLEVFHSGDKSGWVCKIDLESCGDPSEGECVVLCKTDSDDDNLNIFSNTGHENVVRIVGMDDTFVWTATGSSSVKRWRDIPTRTQRRRTHARTLEYADNSVTPPFFSPSSPPDPMPILEPTADPTSTLPSNDCTPQTAVFNRRPSLATTDLVSDTQPNPLQQTSSIRETSKSSLFPPVSSSASSASCPPHKHKPQLFSTSSNLGPSVSNIIEETLDCIPLDALVPLLSPNDLIGPGFGHLDQPNDQDPSLSISAQSFDSNLNLSRHPTLTNGHSSSLPTTPTVLAPHREVAKSVRPHLIHQSSSGPFSLLSATEGQAWNLYRMRDSSADAIPLRDTPDEIIRGRSGLIKSELLNDRRHVITVDTAGQLALWDIVSGTCKGIFTTQGLRSSGPTSHATGRSSVISSESDLSSTSSQSNSSCDPKPSAILAMDLLKLVRDRIEGEATIPNWCTVETQTGMLTVHLEEHRCFDAEVYADEADLLATAMSSMKDDHRISLGKWVLRNLFDGFINQQIQLRDSDGNFKVPHSRVSSHRSSMSRDLTSSQTRSSSFSEPTSAWSMSHPDLAAGTSSNISHHDQGLVGRNGLPRTPGMTISLARPALTPALPPDLKPFSARTKIGDMASMTSGSSSVTSQPFRAADSISHSSEHPSLPMLVETAEDDDRQTKTISRPPRPFLNRGHSSPRPISTPTNVLSPQSAELTSKNEAFVASEHAHVAGPTPSASVNLAVSGSILGRLKALSRGQRRRQSQDPSAGIGSAGAACGSGASSTGSLSGPRLRRSQTTPELGPEQVLALERSRAQQEIVQSVLLRPFQPCGLAEAPKLELPPETAILISEEGTESGTWEVTYRGLVSTTEEDWHVLESVSPGWLLEFLWGNRTILKDSTATKVTFVLEPEGGKEAAGLPELPNGNARLTAARVLRMRKVAAYVAQKLELDLSGRLPLPSSPSRRRLSSASSGSPHVVPKAISIAHSRSQSTKGQPEAAVRAEEEIELMCNGISVAWTMSLGAVKQWVWASGGDVVIGYRWRKKCEL